MNIPWQTSSRFIQHAYPLLMGISPRVMCVVCGGGCGYVLVPRDVRLIKETNRKQLIMSAHLCSCWLVFLFLVHLFALFCPFLLLFALFCPFLLFLLFFALFALFGSYFCSFCLFRSQSCLLNIFFLLMSALSGFFFCLFLYLFALVLAHFCIFVFMSALVCSIRLFLARWLFFAKMLVTLYFMLFFWWKYM